ncbi:MAG: pilus assembly protein PilM [Hungatella sp.]|nr:pilus assembly protein PilM [Hungatella sp.]
MARSQVKKTPVPRREKGFPQAKIPMKEQDNDVVFALDIGTRSIIGMVGVVEDGKVNIIAVDREEHAQRAMNDGQIENIEKVSGLAGKIKKRLEEKTRIKLSRVCVAAAGRALKTKRADYELELPGTQLIDDEIISRLEAGAITKAEEAFEADNESAEDARRFYLVGYTVCQYFLDQYMISNLKDHRGRQIKVDLIATFLPSEVVESLYTTMNKIGLEVASLTLEPIAAINAAIPENIRLLNLVMVDIGAGTSDIAACTGGSVTGYTMATMAGDEVTETIMRQYLVDFSTAESMKMQLDDHEEICFTDILGFEQKLSRTEIFKCIRGAEEALSKEIADKVIEINGTAPSALFLAGGGSKLAGLKEGITEALGMDANRVAIAGNYFRANAFSREVDLNNPEYATPLGIVVSSGLNMINDSFRVTLNGRPAKLFRSGTFTALNLLMMNGYNFRDIMGRPGTNVTVTVNGKRKVFYGTVSEPASLLINQKEGKLSDIIHAGDDIRFVPAIQGKAAKPCLKDVEGAAAAADISLNGMGASLKTLLKNGDVISIKYPEEEKPEERKEVPEANEAERREQEAPAAKEPERKAEEEAERRDQEVVATKEAEKKEQEALSAKEEEERAPEEGTEPEVREALADKEAEYVQAAFVQGEPKESEPALGGGQQAAGSEAEASAPGGGALERLSRLGGKVMPLSGNALEEKEADAPPRQVPERETVEFLLNGESLRLPKKEDGRPYYLMDLIQYSGIDLEHPKGTVTLNVNGETGRFQQVLRARDVIQIREERRE